MDMCVNHCGKNHYRNPVGMWCTLKFSAPAPLCDFFFLSVNNMCLLLAAAHCSHSNWHLQPHFNGKPANPHLSVSFPDAIRTMSATTVNTAIRAIRCVAKMVAPVRWPFATAVRASRASVLWASTSPCAKLRYRMPAIMWPASMEAPVSWRHWRSTRVRVPMAIQVSYLPRKCSIRKLITTTNNTLSTGERCETKNLCASSPCRNGATCTALAGSSSFTCSCPPGFTGDTCSYDIEECQSNPCKYGGTCVNTHGSYQWVPRSLTSIKNKK